MSITREKIIEEAKRRGWKVDYFGPRELFYEITTPDGRSHLFRGSSTAPWISRFICMHKSLSLQYVQRAGFVPTPFLPYTDAASAERFLRQHHSIVVKPEDASQSRGVTVGVRTVDQLHQAIAEARAFSGGIMLQKEMKGQLYRILTVGGKFCAAVVRSAPFVVGDGQRTIRELILEKNADPLRGETASSPLKKISLEEAAAYVAARGRSLNDILPPAERVMLSAIASVSAGGEAADVTDEVHKSYVEVVERISQKLHVPVCGFDLMTEDIAQPLGNEFPMLEMNSMPGLKMHYYPTAGGQPRNVATNILDAVFDDCK